MLFTTDDVNAALLLYKGLPKLGLEFVDGHIDDETGMIYIQATESASKGTERIAA